MDRPLRLLLVEGHERVRHAFARRLRRISDARLVGAVADCASAIPQATRLAPDVVLCEPRATGGMAGLRRLVAAGRPVVVWTSSLTEDEEEHYLRAGVAAVLLKDGDLPALLKSVRSVLLHGTGGRCAHRVLVVDDDAAVRDLLAVVLGAEGYVVRAAENGAEALALIDMERPDLILLDMMMPVMDGWQFAQAYRQRPGPPAPIVVCTAVNNAATSATQIGAAAHLPKPFKLTDLCSCVARNLLPAM